MRQLAVAVLLLAACSKRVPEVSDSGVRMVTPSVTLTPSATSRLPPVPSPPLRPSSYVGAPPSYETSRCLKQGYTRWADLEGCLKSSPTPKFAMARPPAVCPAWSVPAWVFASGGSTDNTCVDGAHPCPIDTTGTDEVQARYGCGAGPSTSPIIGQATTLTYTGDQPLPVPPGTKPIVWQPWIVDGGSFTITGTSTTIASITLGTVTAKNRLAGQALNADLGVGAASYAANFYSLINTTRSNTQAWPDSVVSGNVALLSQPLGAGDAEVDTWATSDAVTVVHYSNVYPMVVRPYCGVEFGSNLNNPTFCADRVQVNNITIPNVSHAANTYWALDAQHVHFHNARIASSYDFTGIECSSCWLAGSVENHNFTNSALIGGIAGGSFYVSGVADQFGVYIGQDAIVHLPVFFPVGSITTVDSWAVDPTGGIFLQGGVYAGTVVFGSGTPNILYTTAPTASGPQIKSQYTGAYYWSAADSSHAFSPGIVLQTDLATATTAVFTDRSQFPMKEGVQPLTVANASQAIATGGFNGAAYNSTKTGGFFSFGPLGYTNHPYIAQPFTNEDVVPDLPSLVVWYRGDFVTVNAGRDVYISDQSANLNDITPNSNGPINTYPYMQFNGSDTFAQKTGTCAAGLGNNTTVYTVVKVPAAGASAFGTFFVTDQTIMLDNVGGSVPGHWGTFNSGGACDSGHNIDDGNVHVLGMRIRSAADLDLFTDGAKTTTGCGPGFNTRECELGGDTSVHQLTGFIGEAVFYNALHTDTQMDWVMRGLAGRYGAAYSPLTGVSSVTGTSGVSCSPTVGAVTCSNTGATSVTGGTGITCSPTTGAVVCSDNCTTCLPDPVTVAHGGTGDTTLTAHAYLLGQGTSAVTTLGACGLENIPYGQGTGTDPICSTFKLSGPGPSGNILKSDGTDWQSVAFGTPTTISSSVNHGGPTALTNAYQTIATLTISVTGTTVDCHAGAEWDITTSASSPQQINWGISQDSSTTPTNVHSLDAATGAAMTFSLGAADEELYNPSASSHTYRVLAEFATAQTNVTSNAFRADLLCLQH